jgi:hypothetical protein
MRGRLARSLLPVAVLGLVLGAAPAAGAGTHQVHDPEPITPKVYFQGIVNNHPPGQAIIAVVCAMGATTGHPAPNQYTEAEPLTPPVSTGLDVGYTGSKGRSINATLPTSTVVALLAHFTSFYVKVPISTKIEVPCSGSGTVSFTPLPTSKTARTAMLGVTFGNITTG